MFLAVLYILLHRYTYQNTLNIVLKKIINLEQNFSDFVKNIHEDTKNTISNQLLEILSSSKNSSSLRIVFTYSNLTENALTVVDSIPEFDLNFEVNLSSNVLNLEFNTNLFEISTAKSLLSHYFFILKQISESKKYKLLDFEMVTPEESKLLEKFSQKGITFNNDAFLAMFDTKNQQTKIYILDNNLMQVPIGNIRGSIYIW